VANKARTEDYFIFNFGGFSREIATVPADASSIQYHLVKVLEKQPYERLRIRDIWTLVTLNGEEYDAYKTNKHHTLEFNTTEMRFFGNNGCNNIFGGIETLTNEKLQLGAIAGTRMACPDMEISDKFNRALSELSHYSLKDMQLYLYNENNDELVVLKKVD